MTATQPLIDEHKDIKLMLEVLQKVSDKLEVGEKVSTEHLDKMVDFIKTFADKCHHAKEENLLFPALEKAGVPKDGGPISVMLMEHNMGRDYVKGFSEGVDKYKAGDRRANSEIIKNARAYVELLGHHIDKEDNILYPMADAHLSKEQQEELAEGFEKIENERIGEGKHEEYHELLKQLKEFYLT